MISNNIEEVHESDNGFEGVVSENGIIENYNKPNKKRKLSDSNETKAKKNKTNKKWDLYKQPTVEELNQLRETENLFHSNLFRIQIEEFLDEVKIKPKYKKLMDAWFEKFVENIHSIEETNEFQLNNNQFLKKLNVEIPFEDGTQEIEGSMKFMQPHSTNFIGSYLTNSVVGPEAIVDIMIEIPPTVMKSADCKNYAYLKKRAIYLAFIAKELNKDLFAKISFYGNLMKPMLKIVPSGKLGSKITVLVHCGVHFSKEKFKKCFPEKCNVNPEWFFKDEIKEEKVISTPYYNSIISHDMTMSSMNELIAQTIKDFPHIRDALILLKIWLKQKEVGKGFDSFNSYVITAYVLYLLQAKTINTHMSSYQIVKVVWLALVQNDWTNIGFSLCQEGNIETRIENYRKYYSCVFLDVTGYHNIAAHITQDEFKYIQTIANDSLESLNNAAFTAFTNLFITNVPLYTYFDMILCVHGPKAFKILNKNCANKEEMLNFGLDKYALSKHSLVKILKQGFGERLDKLLVFPRKNYEWCITEQIVGNSEKVYIGLNFNREYCFSTIEKGPEAQTQKAKEFRNFWDTKSDLRRFKDGTIREAIVWGQGKTLCNKRYISKKILTYLMQKKVQIAKEDYFILSNEIEQFLKLPKDAVQELVYGTGEEATLKIFNTFNELNSNLRNLKDLPLSINGVQGISSAFRYAAVFPPLGIYVSPKNSVENENHKYLKLKEDYVDIVPDYIAPLEMTLQLSSSGKWPEELEAFRKMKAAFNLQIAGCLRGEYKLKAQGNMNYIDVFKNGYIFRMYIAHQKEIALVKEIVEDGVTKYVDTEESIELEKTLFHMPKLNSALHGLYCSGPAFGQTCCLAKRWLSSHLIDNWHFSDIAVDLIIASLFMKPLPYRTPNLPQVAFMRFLRLCSENNWQLEPIIVNFNNELSRDDIIEIENSIATSRDSLPPLVICTPYDKNSIWTKKSPNNMILTRVSFLAKEALKIIETQLYSADSVSFDAIFKPPLSEYDCLICLKNRLNPVKWQSIHFGNNKFTHVLHPYKENQNDKIPIVDFNPIQLYLKELRENYGEFALFFNDTYGGSTIAVLFKPTALEVREFKVTNVSGRKLKNQNTLTLNVNALIEAFYTLGRGLVEDIKFQSKNISLD